jgi:PKHD-type hydroxylase
MLLKLGEVLSADELDAVSQVLRRAPWADGRATAGTQSGGVKNNTQLPESCAQARAAQKIVLAALGRCAGFIGGALPKRIYPPLFNRYAGMANAFGDHIDNAVRTHPATQQNVRTDLSATLFLSDPRSYQGGELVVCHSYGEERIKLEAGDLLLYPGNSVHRVEPVTSGERLAAFFWVESMVRSHEQRAVLHQMDGAISSLRARLGESPEAVSLVGCYHNLVRLWADVA